MSKRKFGAVARGICALTAMVALAGPASWARADQIDITGDNQARLTGRGSFSGSLDYLFDSESGEGRLLITVTNDSSVEFKGFITALVFNIDSADPNATAEVVDPDGIFKNAANQMAGPFGGRFDAGVGLKGKFMGGGKPKKGIGAGDSITFEFRVLASDAADLTAQNFISGPFDFNFLVRFRGFTGPSGADIVPVSGSPVPGPSALACLAVITALSSWRPRKTA